MTDINWTIVESNLREAREQLEALERLAETQPRDGAIKLQVGLEHAYHHLNVAWNARRASEAAYRAMSDADFNRWGAFPQDLELVRL